MADDIIEQNVDTGTVVDNAPVDNTLVDNSVVDKGTLDSRLDSLIENTRRPGEPVANASKETQVDGKPVAGPATTNAAPKPVTQATATKPPPPLAPNAQQPGDSATLQSATTPRTYGAGYKVDVSKNVIDARTGAVVAYAGAERKAFERMLPHINEVRTQAEQYRVALESASAANAIASKLNLTPEEFSIGARIMNVFKSDPKQAIRFMLQEATNNGIDTSDLGAGGGVSVNAIKETVQSIVTEALKPFSVFTQERQQQEETQQAQQQAQEFINEFATTHPDAVIHFPSIAKIMNAKPGTDANTAYLILQNHALRNGFDWSHDLVPQIQARVNGANGTTTTVNNTVIPANAGNRNLPNMNGRANSDAIGAMPKMSLSGDKSSGDVVKEAMRLAGMDISNI